MAALMASLASPTFHCHAVSALSVVPETRSLSKSSVQLRSERLGAVGTLSSGAYGLNQAQESLPRKLVRKGVAVVRIQGVAGVEVPAVEKTEAEDSVHKVLIVGAGIAGLSAAVALHRVGVKVHVLEQSSSIRAAGTSLSLWTNAWRALDCLGVADGLREKHLLVSGPHEVRGVERRLLIGALAAQLPAGSIQLNARVRAIRKEPGEGLTKVELENGSVLSTKVLMGCDGANSVVAKWMGLPPTRYVGQIGIRGVAEYPNGHEFGTSVLQYLGKGDRCGIFPFSDSKVYWFYLFKSSSSTPGPKITDRSLVKAEALRQVQDGWPEKMKELVNNTPVDSFARSALSDRWNIPGVTPPLIREGVALAGDAMHPMTPSLGQGGGTAIEDGVALAQTLGAALAQDGDDECIQKALEEYAAMRQQRTFAITVKSFILGALFAIQFPPILYIRNNIFIPKLASPSSFLSSTFFDVGKLPTSKVTTE